MAGTGPVRRATEAPKNVRLSAPGAVGTDQAVVATQRADAAGHDLNKGNQVIFYNPPDAVGAAPPALPDDATVTELQAHQNRLACFIRGYAAFRKADKEWVDLHEELARGKPRAATLGKGLELVEVDVTGASKNLEAQNVPNASLFLEKLSYAQHTVELIVRGDLDKAPLFKELKKLFKALAKVIPDIEEECLSGMEDELGGMSECLEKLRLLPKSGREAPALKQVIPPARADVQYASEELGKVLPLQEKP